MSLHHLPQGSRADKTRSSKGTTFVAAGLYLKQQTMTDANTVSAADAAIAVKRLQCGYANIEAAHELGNGCISHCKTPNEKRYVKMKVKGS